MVKARLDVATSKRLFDSRCTLRRISVRCVPVLDLQDGYDQDGEIGVLRDGYEGRDFLRHAARMPDARASQKKAENRSPRFSACFRMLHRAPNAR